MNGMLHVHVHVWESIKTSVTCYMLHVTERAGKMGSKPGPAGNFET